MSSHGKPQKPTELSSPELSQKPCLRQVQGQAFPTTPPPAKIMRSVCGLGTEALLISKGIERVLTVPWDASWRRTTWYSSVCEQW